MAKKILIPLGAIVAVIALVIAVLGAIAPTDLHVEREVVIDKPKDVVFSELKQVKNHEHWSPWFKLDPDLTKEYRGEDGTVGFVSAWSGNDKVGVGEMEVKKITEGERIDFELRFKKPMEDTSAAYLITEAAGENQTKVKWGMQGKTPFPGNVMCMLFNMKKMLAAQFDEGLGMLKKRLESEPAPPAATQS
jgi:uncharacterized protein YndB with AHSA1/START domain